MSTLPIALLWGLARSDLSVIAAYFAVILYVGYRAQKRVRNQSDYFLGGRRFGKAIQTFAAFGQGTSVESVTVTTTMVAANGAAGIWANLAGGIFNMPVLWMTSVWYRRLRLITLAEFFEERFGSRAMAGCYSLCQVMFMVVVAAIGLTAMSKTVAAIASKPLAVLTPAERAERDRAVEIQSLDSKDYKMLSTAQQNRLLELHRENPRREFSYVNENLLIEIVAIVTLGYTVAGGLEAAFITDLIQGSFILVLTVLLIPFGVHKINTIYGGSGFLGACQAMHRALPASAFELWGSPNLAEFSWYWIAAFSVLGVLNVAVQSNQLTACGSAKDEKTARSGFVWGIFLKRYSTVLWGLVAMMTLLLYGATVGDPDYVWGFASRDLLGAAGIGLVGLMISCLMAALMASKSAMMLTTSALLTRNVYAPMRPEKSDQHYVWAGRIFNVLYMIASVMAATSFKSVFGLLKFITMFNSIVAATFWLGMLWRRANRLGAWSSILITLVLTTLLPFGLPLIRGLRTNSYLSKTTQPIAVTHVYRAEPSDVSERAAAIERWDSDRTGTRLAPLVVGQSFEKTYMLPPRSVFWNDGLKVDGGQLVGQGFLKVDLVLIDLAGWDLSHNSYSLNETITMLVRIVIPIGVLIVVSLLTPADATDRLDQFFGKMRTKVLTDPVEDAKAMESTKANPRRFDHLKLFPNSSWQFRKWDGEDLRGVIGSSLAAAGCVALLILLIRLGS